MSVRKDTDCLQIHASFLGAFSLRVGIHMIQLSGAPKMQGLLAYLLLNRSREVIKRELLERFWAEEDGASPVSALKTSIYRLRALLKPLFPPTVQTILSQYGSYRWNPDIDCAIDAEYFADTCAQAKKLPAATSIMLYRQILPLYEGDLLPDLAAQGWYTAQAARYHQMYIDAVKRFADLLLPQGAYAEIQQICLAASRIEPLDEGLHIRSIRAMLGAGVPEQALQQYQRISDMLYQNLQERPSERFHALHRQILLQIRKTTADTLETALQDILKPDLPQGAYFCPYTFFRECCRLAVRDTRPEKTGGMLCMVSVKCAGGRIPSPDERLEAFMGQVQQTLLQRLKGQDILAQYSYSQFILFLPEMHDAMQAHAYIQDIISTCQHSEGLLHVCSSERELPCDNNQREDE